MRRAIVLIIYVVAMVNLAGCGGSLGAPDGAATLPDGGTPLSDSGPSFPDGWLSLPDVVPGDANGGGQACVLEVPALEVPGSACLYAIPAPPCNYVNGSHISIRVDGVAIPYDPSNANANGWAYTDATMQTFEIHGPPCEALTSGSATEVIVVFRILI